MLLNNHIYVNVKLGPVFRKVAKFNTVFKDNDLFNPNQAIS